MGFDDIKKYLEGKTTEIESRKIQEWLKNPKNDVESRKILGEIWSKSEISVTGKSPDFELMLNDLHHQINGQETSSQISNIQSRSLLSGLYVVFSKVAAILVLPLILLSIYLYLNPQRDEVHVVPNTVREIYTKPGTRIHIDLSDGTRVWLNDGTTFRYPEKFMGNKREVFVDGEAYFEVKSNSESPFVVNNPMMNTIVTGTHFNLHAYSSDKYFEATLIEGKIDLENGNRNLVMKPGEQVQFDSQIEKIVQKTVNPQNAAAWVDGKLIFKDEKLGTAIRKLARWYNVEIILSDPEINNYLVTGTIQEEKLDQTLNLISLALPVKFEYKRENNPTEIQRIIYMKKK